MKMNTKKQGSKINILTTIIYFYITFLGECKIEKVLQDVVRKTKNKN